MVCECMNCFPKQKLQSKLFRFGRKSLQECLSVVRKSVSTKWKQFKFVVFDAPGKEGIFEERYKYLTELIEPNHPHVMIAEQIKCESREHLEALHKIINYRGGEGVMLRKPQSDYVGGRSGILFKAKVTKKNQKEKRKKREIGFLLTFFHSSLTLMKMQL